MRGGMTCVAGDTWILTGSRFMRAEEIYGAIEVGSRPTILCYDQKTKRAVWRKIIAAGKRKSRTIEVAVSQTGRSKLGTLRITPDHKLIVFDKRKTIKKPLQEVLKDSDFACVVERIPNSGTKDLRRLAYLVGALFTDGYVSLRRTKGSVTFTQNPDPSKQELISTVRDYFSTVFGKSFNIERTRTSNGTYLGRVISGKALDLICTSREPAAQLSAIWADLARWILDLDEESILCFIAGAVDGDGTLSGNRVEVFNSDREFVQGLVVACLRLGIVPQVTSNRNIYNVQIVERLEDILAFTHRVRGPIQKRLYGSKLFSARSLFIGAEDVAGDFRAREYVRRNLLIDAKKVLPHLRQSCPEDVGREILGVVSSDLRNARIRKTRDLGDLYVYNFEVEAKDELDKNFVAFTDSYVPILVSNSHAAVVARGMGKPAVVGCSEIEISQDRTFFTTKSGEKVRKGETVTIDGTTGAVYRGEVRMVEPEPSSELNALLKTADGLRRMGVWANADTPEAALKAREFGAEGIGLCRTERMFNAPNRLPIVREMIMSRDVEARKKHLFRLFPFQLSDFKGIFSVMGGKPVVVRLLDLPLHEFLPPLEDLILEIQTMKERGAAADEIRATEVMLNRVRQLLEHNPMIGHRGCRLAVTYPEIYEMQTKAILQAAIELSKEGKERAEVKIMIPLVAHEGEFRFLRGVVDSAAGSLFEELGERVDYQVGTMIETPRAALTAAEIAKYSDFFSFGTNDLTQTTFGFSRDDVEAKFIPQYIEMGILAESPFDSVDVLGVGRLIKMAIEDGRRAKPGLEVGICGEQGGDPKSIAFFNEAGLNYVSCSAFRVPVARLAAAQAAMATKTSAVTA